MSVYECAFLRMPKVARFDPLLSRKHLFLALLAQNGVGMTIHGASLACAGGGTDQPSRPYNAALIQHPANAPPGTPSGRLCQLP